ncbi:hypothetical protein C2E20_1753 [Micractinium conductrix]|uniref:Transcriptional regulator n=1 Tax=Micractinium conductrix TaxID=554055 RepID=A0A2P6VLG4_9CHLO|nr:hypothetical protein C2E20_1753 [Micractinium conductrix]|eukprot:PSC74897.1 hypothetical protein C2E20_1753 [Micractinium conductrix]
MAAVITAQMPCRLACRPPAYRMSRSALVCRAEAGNEEQREAERQFGGDAQPQWQQQGQEQHRFAEQPMTFTPDLDFPPVLVQDWRAFRARLVAMEGGQTARAVGLQLGREERWAHLLAQPERGCLLVARPRPGLGMFANTVILLLEHEDGEGSSGLILNMPTPLLINNLGLEEDIADAFRHCPLFIGGPVTKNLLHVLHGRRDVEGALEIIEGVYAGGVEAASALVRRGEASPKEFMLLSGYSGWGPWQLQAELRQGTWLPVAASQAVIMDCLRESLAWDPAAWDPTWHPTAPPRMGVSNPMPNTEDVKRQCWQRVLSRAGIEPHMLGML